MKNQFAAILLLIPSATYSKSPTREARESVYFASKVAKLTSGSQLFVPNGLARTKTYLGGLTIGLSVDPAVHPKKYATFSGKGNTAQFNGANSTADLSVNIKIREQVFAAEYGDFFFIELKPKAWSSPDRPRRIPVVLVESQETCFAYVGKTTATATLNGPMYLSNVIYRDAPFDTTATLYYQTYNGTALAGVDFTADAGIIAMFPGQSSVDMASNIDVLNHASTGKSFGIYVSSLDTKAAVFPHGANTFIHVTIDASE